MSSKKSGGGAKKLAAGINTRDLTKSADTMAKALNLPDDPKVQKISEKLIKQAFDNGYVVNFQIKPMEGQAAASRLASAAIRCACACICACVVID